MQRQNKPESRDATQHILTLFFPIPLPAPFSSYVKTAFIFRACDFRFFFFVVVWEGVECKLSRLYGDHTPISLFYFPFFCPF